MFYRISVRLGENNLNTEKDCEQELHFEDCSNEPLDITVEEQIPHELYNPSNVNQQHDIALLRLSTAVEYTSNTSNSKHCFSDTTLLEFQGLFNQFACLLHNTLKERTILDTI